MKKINYKQIILHFVATCFFISSSSSFSRLYNSRILKIIFENGVENILKNPEKYEITTMDMSNFSLTTSISNIIGIIVAFFISIIISIKNKWSILNSIIVLMICFILNRFILLDLNFIYAGSFTKNLILNFSISGLLFLIIGGFIFFSNFLTSKINSNSKL